jgi:hypothetical protein
VADPTPYPVLAARYPGGYCHAYPSTSTASSTSMTFLTGSSVKLPPPGRVILICQVGGGSVGTISTPAVATLF